MKSGVEAMQQREAEKDNMQRSGAGTIVAYVVLVLAVGALLFFVINWLRCMRRRQRYVDEDEMEEVPNNTI